MEMNLVLQRQNKNLYQGVKKNLPPKTALKCITIKIAKCSPVQICNLSRFEIAAFLLFLKSLSPDII